MKVGWSAEVKRNEWIRLDLDESDLTSLLYEAGFPIEKRHLVPSRLAYQILDNETQRLIVAKLATQYGLDSTEATEQINTLKKARELLFNQLQAIGAGQP